MTFLFNFCYYLIEVNSQCPSLSTNMATNVLNAFNKKYTRADRHLKSNLFTWRQFNEPESNDPSKALTAKEKHLFPPETRSWGLLFRAKLGVERRFGCEATGNQRRRKKSKRI